VVGRGEEKVNISHEKRNQAKAGTASSSIKKEEKTETVRKTRGVRGGGRSLLPEG